MRLLQVLFIAFSLTFSSGFAAEPAAWCEITARGERIDGPCRFVPRRGGSFDISMIDGRSMGGATSLSLDIIERGRGEIRGLTAYGVRSRWGEARRMGEDRACWRGSDFTICVRAMDEAPPSTPAPATIFVGRCHMDACTWIDQPPTRLIGNGSPAVPGRRVETTVRLAHSEHPGGIYPQATPDRLAWSPPQAVEYFCSPARPAFREADGRWTVLPLPQVFGATESITRQYLRACHPETAAADPYEAPVLLGYSGGIPAQDIYPDFDALIRG